MANFRRKFDKFFKIKLIDDFWHDMFDLEYLTHFTCKCRRIGAL